MNRARLLIILAIFPLLILAACVENQGQFWQQGSTLLNGAFAGQAPLSTAEIGRGLKEALQVGSGRVVVQLGQQNGFYSDPAIHIPLPKQLHKVQSTLASLGLASLLDDLELKLNRAAETATPPAKRLFWQAIDELTFADIMSIYNGPDDAATRYMQQKMSPQLGAAMRPVVVTSLHKVGAIKAYDRAIGKYQALPLVPDVKADLTTYVVEQGMAGIFHYLALEEKAIRRNPAKRTTELLRRLFDAG